MSNIKFLDLSYRESCINTAIKATNSKVSGNDIKCLDKKTLDSLKTDGYIKLDNFVSEEEAASMKNYFESQWGYNSHTYCNSDKVLLEPQERHKYSTFCYDDKTILNCPYFLEKAANKDLIAVAKEYLGCLPNIYSLASWWYTATNAATYCTQKNHRDHETYKALTLFIYLTDVDDQNSPHVFYPKTHNQFNEDDQSFLKTCVAYNGANWGKMPVNGKESIRIMGKAGTAILADTFAIHRADPIISGNRLICWLRYGCNLDFGKKNRNEYPGSISLKQLFPKSDEYDLAQEHLFAQYLTDCSNQYKTLIS